MNQESNPRFSHITVGQTGERAVALSEDEEVIAIGAVDTARVARAGDAAGALPSEGEGDAGVEVPRVTQAQQAQQGGAPQDARPSENDAASEEDEDFGGPMSLPYKIVASACGVGVIVVIAYLVNYYWIAPH